jgi:hypothetical protein
MARLPTPVETEEVREAHALVSRIFPPDYPTEERYPVSYIEGQRLNLVIVV